MKKTLNFFLAIPVIALGAFACTPEPEKVVEEPVKYELSADPAFVNGEATVTVTADKAAAEDVTVTVVLDESTTLPAEALDFPETVVVKAGETEAKAEVTLNDAQLEPGDYKAVFSAKVGDVNLLEKVTITFGKAIPAMTVAQLKEILAKGTQEAPAAFKGEFTDVVVTLVNGKNTYVEDATAGVLLYGDEYGLQAGVKLSGVIDGEGYLFKGNTHEVTRINSKLEDLTVTPVEALPSASLTVKELNDNFAKYASMRVKLTGVKNAEKDLAKADNNVSQGTDVIDLYVNQTPKVTVEKGSTFDVTGIAVYYGTTQELKIWSDDAISNIQAPVKVTTLTRIWGKYPGDNGANSVWTDAYSTTLSSIVNNDRTMAADDKYVYVAAAGAGISGVLAIDIKDGKTAKAVNLTGVSGGYFPTACVRTIYDPVGKKWILLVGTLAYDSDQTFNVYAYTNGIDAAPTKVISWNAAGRRVGDFFNVVGDWSDGEIWARSNGTTHAFMWTIKNGVVGGVLGTGAMGYDGSKGMGQIYKYDVASKQALLVTPTIGRFFSYDDSEGYINTNPDGVDWAKTDNSAFAKMFGITPFEFAGEKYIAYVRKLDARRSILEIIEDKGSADTFMASIEENSVKNQLWKRPVQNKNDQAQTEDELRAILDTGDGSMADQEMSNCSVVPVEDGVLIVAHHYRVGVVVFKMSKEVAE